MLIVLVLICGALAGAALAAHALRRGRERLREELTSLSADVLSRTGESLAGRMADARRADEERAAGEMARRTEEIKGVVGPVAERLVRMEGEIGRLERERVKAQGELAQMVRQLGEGVGTLRDQAANLATALRRPATRGAWGELQLRNVVEMAGMVEHCDFFEQHTITGEDGDLRPDML
ncbi:MAG TPA: DNA recombination protein RmuC, partial [Solirubrobacteraceae bacterium]|nr:DNA recombination protein RmuC [Solirubrobacteraceae bacterium]